MSLEERIASLERRVQWLETMHGKLGPKPSDETPDPRAVEKVLEGVKAATEETAAPPVMLIDGSPVPEDGSHRELLPNGQQKGYVVLTKEERAKGFVRPVRRSYVHLSCGSRTTMSDGLAETYARDPKFYSGTFCCSCRKHFPLDQFVWFGTGESLGS